MCYNREDPGRSAAPGPKSREDQVQMENGKREFIEFMLASDVLRFGEFTTKSGRLSPYFINTGNYRTGRQISVLADFYARSIRDSGVSFDALFGPAYKGIPLAAAAAAKLYEKYGIDKPYFFNRKEAKDHGEGGSLVGYRPKDGDRVAIVEDVVTAGTAVRETVPVLRCAADVRVSDMFISVNRMEVGQGDRTATEEILNEFGITVHAIVTVRDIRDYLEAEGRRDQVALMEAYMEKYCRI